MDRKINYYGRTLGIIAARGKSTGLKKNILVLGDKPVIAWSIESAVNSRLIDRTIVSTDDTEIADIAKEYGGGCSVSPSSGTRYRFGIDL